MVVGDDFIFFHLQKTGGTFIEKFLLTKIGGTKKLLPTHQGFGKIVVGNRKTFGAVRNPWSWYVSWWASRVQTNTDLFKDLFGGERKHNFKKFMLYVMNEDFGKLHDLDSKIMRDKDIGIYTYRYLKCICDKSGVCMLDDVIYTESLKTDLSNLLNIRGNKKELLFSMGKKNTSSHKNFRNYYDDELIELVYVKDKLIIDRYGYTFTNK